MASYEDHQRERRLELLTRQLPRRWRRAVRWLRRPSVRPLRIGAGVLFIIGGLLAILPIFGLWMLPLGFVLLAEDFRPLRKPEARILSWIERRRPHWMGLPRDRQIASRSPTCGGGASGGGSGHSG